MTSVYKYKNYDNSVSALIQPNDLSDESWVIAKAMYANYLNSSSKDFDQFNQFDFSPSELIKYCQELHDNGYAFFYSDDIYLYMLPKVIYCLKSYSSNT